jgi:hypothetical protein
VNNEYSSFFSLIDIGLYTAPLLLVATIHHFIDGDGISTLRSRYVNLVNRLRSFENNVDAPLHD